jgi:16S rRNA (cytosine1402-N4)-methyltransferase
MKDQERNQDEGSNYHDSVLLHESIQALNIQKNANYLDATFGGGGHSRAILDRLDNGKLLAFDQDEDALRNIPNHSQLIFVRENFRYADRFARLHNMLPLGGILADFGVSSHQFDTANRGFSIRFDGALDMRMDTRQELTAAHVLNSYDESALHKLFEKYGQVSNAKSLARHIVASRLNGPFESINQFIQCIKPFIRGKENKYLAKVFQAVRIEVNDELNVIRDLLLGTIPQLAIGGRVVVITFHSLEDQIVKEVFKKYSEDEMTEAEMLLGRKEKEGEGLKIQILKPIKPSADELQRNNRSRSAKIRYAERIR